MDPIDSEITDSDFIRDRPREVHRVDPGSAKAWAIFSVLAGLTPILCFVPFAALSMGIMGLSEGEAGLLNLGWIIVMASPFAALISGAVNLNRLRGQTGLPRNLSILGCVLGGLILLAGVFMVL